MASPVQKLRGTSTENAQKAFSEGVLSISTDDCDIHVHDGKTKGGFGGKGLLARSVDYTNSLVKTLDQQVWNSGTSTLDALISPLKLLTALTNMNVWKGGSKFGNNTNGGFILPNGLIIQYGSAQNTTASDYRISFPTTFPTKCFCFLAVSTYGMSGDQFIGVSTSNITTSAADIRCRSIFNGGLVQGQISVPVIWLALGV